MWREEGETGGTEIKWIVYKELGGVRDTEACARQGSKWHRDANSSRHRVYMKRGCGKTHPRTVVTCMGGPRGVKRSWAL